MPRPGSNRGSELLNQIEAIINEELKGGVSALARRVTTRIALEFGGEQIYLPRDKVRRDARIYDDYTGDNIPELRARYHLSESTLYQIIRAQRMLRKMKPGLLPGVEQSKENGHAHL